MPKYTFNPYKQHNIKNIIFDLGGVILDINFNLTIEAFQKIGISNFEQSFSRLSQNELFNKLDCGIIQPNDFRAELRSLLKKDLTDKEIDSAWNALLLNWNIDRLKLIDELRVDYRIFLLSNTNVIHSDVYNAQLIELSGGRNLKSYFEKVYYSYEVGLRKPDPAIFNLVMDENRLIPSETLFIDDTAEHIESAKNLGILTYNINPYKDEVITELFVK